MPSDAYLAQMPAPPRKQGSLPPTQLGVIPPVDVAREIARFRSAVVGEELLWNQSELGHYILRVPSIAEIETIVLEEERKLLAVRWESFVVSAGPGDTTVKGVKERYVAVDWLLGEIFPNCGTISPTRLSDANLEKYAAFQTKPLQEQQAFLRARTPRNFDEARGRMSAISFLKTSCKDMFALRPSETEIADPLIWLGRFHSLLLRPPNRTPRGYLFAVAFQLRTRGILLLSQCAAGRWRTFGGHAGKWGDSPLSNDDPYSRQIACLFAERENELVRLAKKAVGKDLRAVAWRKMAGRISDILWCSTLMDPEKEVSWEFAKGFTRPAGNRATGNPAITAMLKACALKNNHLEIVRTKSTFMSTILDGTRGRDAEMQEWLDLIDRYHRGLVTKTTHGTSSALKHFVLWLAQLPIIPKPLELQRKHIRSDGDPEINTLKRYLEKTGNAFRYLNHVLGTVSLFFEWLERELDAFKQPISYKIDQFKSTVGRRLTGKTHRGRIPSRVLDDVRNFLVVRTEQGFEWSKWTRESSIIRLDGENVFCPIYPAVISMLLRWPLRSNQVLWLDSGELDESYYDFAAGQFTLNPNGVVGRSLGVVAPALDQGALGEGHQLDLQVAVNKRPVGERADYTIPYVDDETIWVIRQVLDFQNKYGAKPRLVKECDAPYNHGVDKSETVRAKLPDICCLFRHPEERGAFPPDSWVLNRFWGKICGAYDDQNAVWLNPVTGISGQRPNWPRLSKKVEKEYQVATRLRGEGKQGKATITARKHQAIHDIHSLRVGGISYLLDRGIPVGIVAAVAGHGSLLMTLHYYVVERGEIRKKLSEAMRENPEMARVATVVEERLKAGGDHSSWLRAMSDAAFSALHTAIENGGNYRITPRGICPGTKCEDGLRIRSKGDSIGETTLVPGSLCGLCIYNLYGPAFLPGLVREFNETLYALEQLARTQIDIRVRERNYEGANNFDEAMMLRSEDELLSRRAEPDCAHLVRLHEMIEESLLMVKEGRADPGQKHALVAMAGARASIELAGSFEQMKEILDTAELLPTMRTKLPDEVSKAFQNRLLGVLVKNGAEPFLAGLPEPVAHRSALDFANLLAKSIPSRADLESVFSGKLLLRDISRPLADQVVAEVAGMASSVSEVKALPQPATRLLQAGGSDASS